ncbi:MAG: RNA 2',3'-cyclic phosphodiesterase [Chloroflexi bacterium]|nr:RNA 2',3'-cyclic phosphodiesterase [Chloroflexota bacterium]
MAPAPVRVVVRRAIERLRPAAPDVRWSDPDSAHLTIQFLGVTDAARLADLVAALARVASAGQPLALRTGGLGVFPSPTRPRVVWLGLTGDTVRLASLQAAVTAATGPLGFATEARPFTAHLTLGRVPDTVRPAERATVGRSITATTAPDPVAWPVDELTLMRSQLSSRGATYAAVDCWRLGHDVAF